MPKELSKGYSQYGAQMGRRDHVTEPDHPIKMHLVRMRMSSCGAYDQGGAYWGCGEPMFHAWGDGHDEEQEMFIRARNRMEARCLIRKEFPNVRFYR
jgi:hypothetical protein